MERDVTNRIQAGWLKWRATTRMLCDKTFSRRLKGKFYCVVIRSALLYGTTCWPVKKGFRTEDGSNRDAYAEVDV